MSDSDADPPLYLVKMAIGLAIDGYRQEVDGDRAAGKLEMEKAGWLLHFNDLVVNENKAELARLAKLRCGSAQTTVINDINRCFAPSVAADLIEKAYAERVATPDLAFPDEKAVVRKAMIEGMLNQTKRS